MIVQKMRKKPSMTKNLTDQVEKHDELTALVADLFERYHDAIFAYLYRLVDDRDLAHDLAQESFLRVFRARKRLPQVENQRAWIYRVARNVALNALKRRQRFTWLPWREADLPTTDPIAESEQSISVEQALSALAPKYREPLLLYSHYGLSVREVAQVVGISEGAVKTRLFRAREMFRQAFEGGNEK